MKTFTLYTHILSCIKGIFSYGPFLHETIHNIYNILSCIKVTFSDNPFLHGNIFRLNEVSGCIKVITDHVTFLQEQLLEKMISLINKEGATYVHATTLKA